jgi:citrate lyase beta subunit
MSDLELLALTRQTIQEAREVIQQAEAAMRYGIPPIDIEEMRVTLARLRGGERMLLNKIAAEAPDSPAR